MKKTLLAVLIASSTFGSYANIFAANKAINAQNYETARVELSKSAKIGNADAQFNLAALNFNGQGGTVDTQTAMAWFYLASQYDYPKAIEFSSEIFQGMTAEEQTKAIALAEDLNKQYGKTALENTLYPNIENKPFKSQIINKKAKMLKRGKLSYSGSALTNARNQASINKAVSNYNRNPGALQNLSKNLIKHDTGRVIVQYDVHEDGRVRDAEVVFSWPKGRFDKAALSAINNSKLRPAKRGENTVKQFGLTTYSTFGTSSVGTLRKGYPHLFKQFKSLKNKENDNLNAKYSYACFLRAYKDLLRDRELESFEPTMLEAAEAGHALAQYDYAQYQIYFNKDIDDGMKWLIKSAKLGYLQAEYKLGDILYRSPSVYLKQDIEKAQYWLHKAATRNHAKAQQKLAEIRFSQENIDRKFAKKVIVWLKKIEDDNKATPETYYLLAKAYVEVGNKSEAKDYMEEAIKEAEKYQWNIEPWQLFASSLES